MGEGPVVGDTAQKQRAALRGHSRLTRGADGVAPRIAAAVRALGASGAALGVWPQAEAALIAVWAIFVTRAYLDMSPFAIPSGLEYLSVIQSHHLWTWVQRCGACALWNGSQQGGAPALVELHGSPLHPLVALLTLLFGVLNGSKIALVAAFVIAGLAQWWLGWVLGLGRLARLWSACMAVVAGHLAGRMEGGLFGVVFSSAACALVLPPIVLMGQRPSLRVAVLLGVLLALAAVSGQGYVQIGLALLLAVVVPIQLFQSDQRAALLRQYMVAALLATLLAGVLLVPFVHFLPDFKKYSDSKFKSNQPFGFVLLNLLIDDSAFYLTDMLQKQPYVWLHSYFIGWISFLLALWGGYRGWAEERRREIQWVAAGALALLWLSSGSLFEWIARQPAFTSPITQLSIIRYPPLFMTLAVPLLLALAGFGLDRLLRLRWPRLRLGGSHKSSQAPIWGVRTHWLLCAPLLIALNDARAYGAQWLVTTPQAPEVYDVLDALRTPDLEWVNPPFGEHFFIEPAVGAGLKLSYGIRQWGWRDHASPKPVLEASRKDALPDATRKTTVAGVQVFAAPGREYAAMTSTDGTRTICSAHGSGGNIDVTCAAPQAGRLQILENSWSGWGAQVNNQPAALLPGQWLAVNVPAGAVTVRFRYRPWDVPLGALCSLCGVALAIGLWRRGERPAPEAVEIRTPVS